MGFSIGQWQTAPLWNEVNIKAFVPRTVDTANIDDVIESADDTHFKQINADLNHVLAYLFPDKTNVHYDFRPRRHYRQLLPKLSKLYDSNFIVHMLYNQSY